jgi:plastocyanin
MGAAVVAAAVVIATGTAAGAGTETATIQDYRFIPTATPVSAGDTVTWTNLDDAPHTVTGLTGPTKLDSPVLHKGQTWSYTFAQAGAYRYYCTVHPSMSATLVVSPAPTASVPLPPTSALKRPASAPPATPAAGATSHTGVATTSTISTVAPATIAPTTIAPTSVGAGHPTAASIVAASTSGPQVNPMLFLLAVAAGAAVFGVLVLGRRKEHDNAGKR